MALDDSALPELLAALRAGDGVDLIRDAVRLVMQELIELEATGVIGAKPYERTDTRVNERNGHRPRMLATQAGDIELKIPKLSHGSFFPALLEPRRRIDQALYAVVMQAYVEGVSTRSVDDLVQALGIDSGISKSQVSRICARLDEVAFLLLVNQAIIDQLARLQRHRRWAELYQAGNIRPRNRPMPLDYIQDCRAINRF